jgi:hypothetical protein
MNCNLAQPVTKRDNGSHWRASVVRRNWAMLTGIAQSHEGMA